MNEEITKRDNEIKQVFLSESNKFILIIGPCSADNEEAVMDVPGVEAQAVYVGIRPEGFELDPEGALSCRLSNVEVMGRDVSIVSTNNASVNPVIRSIIDADNKIDLTQETVRFNLKPHKVFLFNKETEERIRYEVN